jgi:hypothetical protein
MGENDERGFIIAARIVEYCVFGDLRNLRYLK